MDNITYDVPVYKQNIQDCVQASAAQILAFYGVKKSIEEVKKEVPVYTDTNGKLLGSSIGHIGVYFQQLGFKVTLHTCDIEIFDRSWVGLTREETVLKLSERKSYLKHARYDEPALDLVTSGYAELISGGAQVEYPIVDEEYLHELLKSGPIFAVVSFNFLNQVAKYVSIKDELPNKDSIKGNPSSHAIIISGYKDGKFEITDPDYEYGGKRMIDPKLLIAAFYLAETEFDAVLMTLTK